MAARRIGQIAVMGGIVLGGYILMQVVSPNDDELIKKLPENLPSRMDESKFRSQQLLNRLKEAAESPDPVWIPKKK
ncbi:ubiquinol-cytochrome-c reductase complex assembly factor 3-like [Glandiceps talaboti]